MCTVSRQAGQQVRGGHVPGSFGKQYARKASAGGETATRIDTLCDDNAVMVTLCYERVFGRFYRKLSGGPTFQASFDVRSN